NRTTLFGDQDHVFLAEVGADGTVAKSERALRAADGANVAVPDFASAYSHRVRTVGRLLLVREEPGKSVRLRLYDPLTGKDRWQRDFAAGSLVAATDEEQTGVVEPDGTLIVLEPASGKELFKTALKKDHLDKVNEVR